MVVNVMTQPRIVANTSTVGNRNLEPHQSYWFHNCSKHFNGGEPKRQIINLASVEHCSKHFNGGEPKPFFKHAQSPIYCSKHFNGGEPKLNHQSICYNKFRAG